MLFILRHKGTKNAVDSLNPGMFVAKHVANKKECARTQMDSLVEGLAALILATARGT